MGQNRKKTLLIKMLAEIPVIFHFLGEKKLCCDHLLEPYQQDSSNGVEMGLGWVRQ